MNKLITSFLFTAILWVYSTPVYGSKPYSPFNDCRLEKYPAQDDLHRSWDRLLKKHVNAKGLVDYNGFFTDKALLEEYLQQMASNGPKDSWSKAQKMAYYINSYNAYTIKLILDNYPLKSIKDINSPWGKAFIPLNGKSISLDHLENRILRKMDDPRIHFAINCASYSCPPLLNEAYTASRLEEQLDRATSRFINGTFNRLGGEELTISPIFKWYRRDFKVDGQVDVAGYINQFAKIKVDPGAKIRYMDYNWDLNEQK